MSGGSEWRTNCLSEHSMWIDHIQKNLSKLILWYHNVYKQIASDIWEADNPVNKLTMDNPQLVLINI